MELHYTEQVFNKVACSAGDLIFLILMSRFIIYVILHVAEALRTNIYDKRWDSKMYAEPGCIVI